MIYQDQLETNLLQLFAHTWSSEWFSIISVIGCEVNIVAEHVNAKIMTIMGALLHWTQANSFEVVVCQNHGRPQGVKTGICPSLEIGTTNQNFLENFTSAAQLRLIDSFLAMIVYLPVRHSHGTRARFTVLESCSGKIAVHSCPLICLQGQVAKLAGRSFYCWSLLCNNNMATNLLIFPAIYDIRRFAACDCWSQTFWQAMQRDIDCSQR